MMNSPPQLAPSMGITVTRVFLIYSQPNLSLLLVLIRSSTWLKDASTDNLRRLSAEQGSESSFPHHQPPLLLSVSLNHFHLNKPTLIRLCTSHIPHIHRPDPSLITAETCGLCNVEWMANHLATNTCTVYICGERVTRGIMCALNRLDSFVLLAQP